MECWVTMTYKEGLCTRCVCKPLCAAYLATGGANKCNYFYEKKQPARWIEHEWAEEVEGLLISNFECTACRNWVRNKSKYCPNCGAEMELEVS